MTSAKQHLTLRLHDEVFLPVCRRYLRGKLVDIGCGSKPYAATVRPCVEAHVGVDHNESEEADKRPDIRASAYAIPVESDLFDSALCTAVLEHLEEPEAALRECHRILKPGGIAIYTVPFIWHVHEGPRDFYRFSRFGLTYLFEKVGFDVIELKALSGFWGTFGQLFSYNLERANRGVLRRLRVVSGAQRALSSVCYRLDRIDRTEGWTWMYLVVARKPLTSPSSTDPERLAQ